MKRVFKIICILTCCFMLAGIAFACDTGDGGGGTEDNIPKQGTKAVEYGVAEAITALTEGFAIPDIEKAFIAVNGKKQIKEEYSGLVIEDNTSVAASSESLEGFLRDLQKQALEARIYALRSINNTIHSAVALNKTVTYYVPEGVESLPDKDTFYKLDSIDNDTVKEYKYTFFKRIYADGHSSDYIWDARFISISTLKSSGQVTYSASVGQDFFYRYIPGESLTIIRNGLLQEMKITEENSVKTLLAYEYSSIKPLDTKRYERVTRLFYGNSADGYIDANDSDGLTGTQISYYKNGRKLWQYNNAANIMINIAGFANWKNAALKSKNTNFEYMTEDIAGKENGSAEYGYSSFFYSDSNRLMSISNNLDMQILDAEHYSFTENQKILRIKNAATEEESEYNAEYAETKFGSDIYADYSGADFLNINANGISSIRDTESFKKHLNALVSYANLSWDSSITADSIFNTVNNSLRTAVTSDPLYNSMAVGEGTIIPKFFQKWGTNENASGYSLYATVNDDGETMVNGVKDMLDAVIKSYFQLNADTLDKLAVQTGRVSRFDYGGEIIPFTQNDYYNFNTRIDYAVDEQNYAVTKADFYISLAAADRPNRAMFGLNDALSYEFVYYNPASGKEVLLKEIVAEGDSALEIKLGLNDFRALSFSENGTYYFAVKLTCGGKVLGCPVDIQLGKDNEGLRLTKYSLSDETDAEKTNIVVNFYDERTKIEVYKA